MYLSANQYEMNRWQYLKINVDTINVNTMNVNSLVFPQRLSHITRSIVLYSLSHKPILQLLLQYFNCHYQRLISISIGKTLDGKEHLCCHWATTNGNKTQILFGCSRIIFYFSFIFPMCVYFFLVFLHHLKILPNSRRGGRQRQREREVGRTGRAEVWGLC